MNENVWSCKIAAGFRDLGVVEGDTVLVHSSFKSLGPVPGGIEVLVQGLHWLSDRRVLC
jgi:aminoglycoside N3'-acetyltransferase